MSSDNSNIEVDKKQKKKKKKSKKEKKESKKRKRDVEKDNDDHDDNDVENNQEDKKDTTTGASSNNKPFLQDNMNRDNDDGDDDDDRDDGGDEINDDDEEEEDKKKKKKFKKQKKETSNKVKNRRKERLLLMEKIPKVDENGISYTKQQLRRMCKRVAKGLNPIETPAEKHNRLVQDALLKKQEEAELAGMLYENNKKNDIDENNDNENEEDRDNNDEEDHDNDDDEEEPVEEPIEQDGDNNEKHDESGFIETSNNIDENVKDEQQQQPMKKKKRRNKPVPSDYVCSACKNSISPTHWIYDCPQKKTIPGTNQKSKKKNKKKNYNDNDNNNNKGLHEPSNNKVFVSGLPFSVTIKDIREKFFTNMSIQHCKLIKFNDTGRCTGQAYITFDTKQTAENAIKQMNGMIITNNITKQAEKDTNEQQRKNKTELKLKVSKMLNRSATGSSKRGGGGHRA